MIRLLLDTHALIWFYKGELELSVTAGKLITDLNNQCFVSIVSLWEISILTNLGRLKWREPLLIEFQRMLAGAAADLLPIELTHLHTLAGLAQHHRDPFDRLLLAQAEVEKLTIITRDKVIAQYGVPVIW